MIVGGSGETWVTAEREFFRLQIVQYRPPESR